MPAKLRPKIRKKTVTHLPYFSCQLIYASRAISIKIALIYVQSACQTIAFSWPGEVVKKRQIEVIQMVAKIVATKNQNDFNRSPFFAPKNTVAPDKIVRIETVASKMIVSCICLLLNYYIINLMSSLKILMLSFEILTGVLTEVKKILITSFRNIVLCYN